MAKVFMVDVAKCNGCRNCQVVCKDEHCGQSWMPYAQAQPDTGQFWIDVEEKERGTIPKVIISYTPKPCMHCADAPCIDAAEGDAVYRREDGMVVIDPEKARGQKAIVEACPYDAVFWNEGLGLPQKCTGCAHLLDDGWDMPRCADACPTGALRFGEESAFAAEIAQAETLLPEKGTSPRVYYLNLPKRFIGGEVVDLTEDEVLIGAKVVLANKAGAVAETETDDFGDFWFKQIEADVYTVKILADGYGEKSLEVDTTGVDMNIGIIDMQK